MRVLIVGGGLVGSTLAARLSRDGHDVPYGTGVSDVGAILDVLKDSGFDGNISIEYEYNWTTSVPEIAQCVDFVREHGKVNP